MYRKERNAPISASWMMGFALSTLLCQVALGRCWYFELQWPTGRGPTDIDADSSGYLYVACGSDHTIQKFSGAGELRVQWGQLGSGPGQFDSPQGIAVDPWGTVYVADTNNRRIQKFRTDGAFVSQWTTYTKDTVRTFRPFGVATDRTGEYLYVTDVENQRVLKFTSNGFSVRAWSRYGPSKQRFVALQHVATDKLGFVYVVDGGANDVKKFTNLGSFRGERHGSDVPGTALLRPTGVAVDYSGYVFVTDEDHCMHQLDETLQRTGWFGGCDDPEQENQGHWHGLTSQHHHLRGSGLGQFSHPKGVAADPAGNLYVADFDNHRVQKLATLQTSSLPESSLTQSAPRQDRWHSRNR